MKPKGREEEKKIRLVLKSYTNMFTLLLDKMLLLFFDFNFQNTSVIFKIVPCEHFKIRYAISSLFGHCDENVSFLFISLDNL